MMSSLLSRLTPFTNSIDNLCYPLKSEGFCWFTHDITFGKGEISILTNQHEVLSFYHRHAFPALCTSSDGRTLAAGVYITQNLESYPDASQIQSILRQKLKFTYQINILEIEDSAQHLYTFAYHLNENDFLRFAINNIGLLQAFVHQYKIKAKTIIEQVAEPRNRMTLPYGESAIGKIKALAGGMDSESSIQKLDFDTIFSITSEELRELLTKRNYPISLHAGLVFLAKMEICVLVQLLKGSHAGQIGQELGIKQTTVESYLVNIKNKLAVDNKKELIRLVTSRKILQQVRL